jgi:glycosyltransferase involved in cell wall biosynthesis
MNSPDFSSRASFPIKTQPLNEQAPSQSADFERIAAVIPAYNEERFIGSVVLQARQHASVVVVVDDGSKDNTAKLAASAGAIVLRHLKNSGKGVALTTGFNYVRRHTNAEAIVTLDGDGQHRCDEILEVARPILEDRADVVVGSRFLNIQSDIPKWRIFGQHALTLATNLGSNTNLTDSQSGFRAFSRAVLNTFNFHSRGFSVESEMQFMIQDVGLRVVEVPVSVIYAEPSKRNPVKHGMQVVNGILTLIGQYRPFLFFGSIGIVCLVAGFFWGVWVVDIYTRIRELAIGYALISALLMIIGASSLFTGIMLHAVTNLLREIKRAIEQSHEA